MVTTVADSGAGSFREAITRANAMPGADRIEFAIGTGQQTIDLLSALPAISSPLTIAGQTQPGFAGSPLIELNGAGAGADASGIFVRAGGSGSVIRGLVINRFDDFGVRLLRTSCVVKGCFIGTDATGTVALGNGGGASDGGGIEISGRNFVTGAASVIGGTSAAARNVISGNLGDGVHLSGSDSSGMLIQGNYIGTDATGALDLGNSGVGVNLFWGPSGNVIGGTTAGAGNVISGNGGHGVAMEGIWFPHGGEQFSNANRVEGNFIGTNAAGTAAVANDGDGVALLEFTNGNVIGGTALGAGNVISGNLGDGVRLSGSANNLNRVEGNLIGTNAAGTAAVGNDDGVTIEDRATNAVVGGTAAGSRNIISGNLGDGIALANATGNTIQGNFIGTTVDGTGSLGNLGEGISLSDSANNNLIGGTVTGSRNVVSANSNGVVISGSTANRVQGNRIGTDRTGTAALGNSGSGVVIEDSATRNSIGGAIPGAGNVISANGAQGVLIEGTDAALNRVRGNLIGTDRTGTIDLGNTLNGVAIRGGAHNNAIGGDVSGAGNVISGNDASGVLLEELDTEDNLVQGNWIGTDGAGKLDLGNALQGVFITDNASRNSIGGITTGSGNAIAFNGENGVLVGSDPGRGFNNPAGTRNAINQNRIYSNGALGIDLGPNDGVTPNDPLDPDTGPNRLQNFPEIFSAELLPAGLNIEGFIHTEPNRSYRIEFSVSPAADASGSGEGKRYLGFVMVNTDPDGLAEYRVTFSATGVLAGQVVTATATYEFGDTSEFSPAQSVT